MEKVAFRSSFDEGLRSFMIHVFNHTACGLAVSGIVAFLVYSTGIISILMAGFLGWLFILAPLAMILLYSFAGQRWSLSTLTAFYYAFVALMGVSLSTVFAFYTAMSIAQVFFITAATFAAASLYGYTTRKDLTSIGSFLFTGLIGVIIAMIVNLFLASSALMFAISILSVIIFTGLIAYDTQTAKNIYLSANDSDDVSKHSIVVAMSLYLNFINLFRMLLSLLGQRQE